MPELAMARTTGLLLVARLLSEWLPLDTAAGNPGGWGLLAGASVTVALLLAGSLRRARAPIRIRLRLVWLCLVAATLTAAIWEARSRPDLDQVRSRLTVWHGERLWWVRGAASLQALPEGEVRVMVAAVQDSGRSLVRVGGAWALRTDGLPIRPGECWLIRGALSLHRQRRNPAGFDHAAHAWRRGREVGRLEVAGPWSGVRMHPSQAGRSIARSWMPLAGAARALTVVRKQAAQTLESRLPQPAAGLARAMVLGDRSTLDPSVRELFRRLGWSHLLAVSGLHVGFIAACAVAALRPVRRHQPALLAGVLIGYMLLTGAPPSVVRATGMALTALLARARHRSLTTGRALGLAALGVLALTPEWLADPGALLSFSAVLGIVVFGPALDLARPLARFRGRRAHLWIWVPLATGLGAQLGALPVLACTFHAVSPWGVLSSPVAIPLAGLLVASTALGLAVSGVLPPVGGCLLDGASVIALALVRAGEALDARAGTSWPLLAPGAFTLLLYGLGSLALAAARQRSLRGRRLALGVGGALALATALAVMLWGAPTSSSAPIVRLRIEVLDVGQGDAALILAERSNPFAKLGIPARPASVVLVDAGDCTPTVDLGQRVVLPRLRSLGVRRLDALVLTHADRDHVGGAVSVLNEVAVAELRIPPGFEASPRLASAISGRLRARVTTAGDTVLAVGPLHLVAVHPPSGFEGTDNDRSLVLVLDAMRTRMLLTGDIEAVAERILLAGSRGELAADILKVAHHGSATSTGAAFLDAVDPVVAVISAGSHPRFRHPTPEVLRRLREAKVEVWRTDQVGAVVLEIDARGFRLAATARDRATGSADALDE